MTKPVAVFCVTTPMSVSLFGNRFHLLVEAGIDLHIIVGGPISESHTELPTAAKVHVLPMTRSINPLRDLVALSRMIKLQRNLRPKLVVAATPKASLIGLLAARVTQVPVRVWEAWGAKWDGDDSLRASLLKRVDRIVAKSATKTIAVSPSLAHLLEHEGITAHAPRVLGSGSSKGVDTNHFHPNPSRSPHSALTVGFVGRLSRDKGVDEVIAAAQELRKRMSGLRLLLVGSEDKTDPPSDSSMEVVYSADWIELTGWIPDTAPFFRRIDVLIFPSQREGLPNALIEAAASGVPVVAYASTGTVDVVQNAVTGSLVPVNDFAALVLATEKLLSDSAQRLLMARAGRERVTNLFDSVLVEWLFLNFYAEIIANA